MLGDLFVTAEQVVAPDETPVQTSGVIFALQGTPAQPLRAFPVPRPDDVAAGAAVLMAGVVNGTGTTTAVLTVGKPVQGVVNGTSTVTATLTDGKPLKAVVSGTSTVTAVFTLGKPLKGVVTGTSSTAAVLTLGKPIQAVVTSTSTITAILTVGTPPASDWTGVFPWGAYIMLLRESENVGPTIR